MAENLAGRRLQFGYASEMVNAVTIDVSTFQRPLNELAITMALKVEREGQSRLNAPAYVPIDLGLLLRISYETLNLLWYINADKRAEGDYGCRTIYQIVAAPLVRNMLDGLYNITFILQDAPVNGRAFHLSGIKKEQRDLDDDEQRYGSQP